MANTAKKTASADVKDAAAKTAEVKATAETKAAEVKTEAAAKTAAPKTEKKTEAKKPGRKPAAKKETAAKAEKKPAAKKAPAKKAAAAKPAAKRGRPAAKAEEKAAPARRGAKKKQLSYGEVIEAARKKAMAADTTKIKVHIAANIRLTGNYSANENENESRDQFYIDINPETESINVQPYRYEENTFQITADAEELFQVLKGKKNIYDALSDGDFHLEGRLKPAILFIHSVL